MKIPKSYFIHAPILAPASVGLMRKLNRDYLDLLVAGWQENVGVSAFPVAVMQQLSAAPPDVRDTIAACTYSLFTLDPAAPVAAGNAGGPQVNDPAMQRYTASSAEAGAWPAFAMTAWFFAWHLSRYSSFSARIMLGLSATDSDALCGLEPWQLRHIAGRQELPLKPRWHTNPCFWPDLVRFADNGNPLRLSAARLLGMQLLAGDLYPPPMAHTRR